MLVDTHAHIDFPWFDTDRREMLKRASDENIVIIHSGLGVSGIKKAIELTGDYGNVYATLGLPPTELSDDAVNETLDEIDRKSVV